MKHRTLTLHSSRLSGRLAIATSMNGGTQLFHGSLDGRVRVTRQSREAAMSALLRASLTLDGCL